MDRLGVPRSNILAYTLPGFGTSDLTYQNAWKLMRALGVTAAEIDIKPACVQKFKDIAHPYAKEGAFNPNWTCNARTNCCVRK